MKKNVNKKNVEKVLTTVGVTGALLGTGMMANNAHADATPVKADNNVSQKAAAQPEVTIGDVDTAQAEDTGAVIARDAAQATVDSDKQAVNEQTSQVSQNQADVDKAQKNAADATPENIDKTKTDISNQQGKISDDQSQVDQTTQNSKDAQNGVTTAQADVDKQNQVIAGTQADTDQAKTASEQANQTAQSADQAVKDNDANIKNASDTKSKDNADLANTTKQLNHDNQAVKDTQSKVDQDQTNVNNKKATVDADQNKVNQKQSAVNDDQAKTDNIQNQISILNQKDGSVITVPQANYADMQNWTDDQWKQWTLGIKWTFGATAGSQKEHVDLTHLTQAQYDGMQAYLGTLLNQIRGQIGAPEVKIAGQGMQNALADLMSRYAQDNWDVNSKRDADLEADGDIQSEYGLGWIFDNSASGFQRFDGFDIHNLTMGDIQQMVFDKVVQMIAGNKALDWNNSRNLVGMYDQNNGTIYYGMTFDKFNNVHIVETYLSQDKYGQEMAAKKATKTFDQTAAYNPIADREAKLNELYAQLREAQATLATDKGQLANYQTTLANDKKGLDTLTQTLLSDQQTLVELQSQIQNENNRIAQLTTDVANQQKIIDDGQAKSASLVATAQKAHDEATKAQKAYTADLDLIATKKAQLTALEAKLSQAQSVYQTAQAAETKAQKQLTQDQAKLARLQQQLADYKNAKQLLTDAKQKLADSQAKLATLQAQLDTDKTALAKAQSALDAADANLAKVKAQYAADQAIKAAKAAAQKAHDEAKAKAQYAADQAAKAKEQKATSETAKVPAGTTTNINNVPNVKANANGTYTLPNNVVVNANGMATSIEETDVVPNEFYVNDQGQIINLKGDVLQPVVALGQSETKASQKQSGLAQFTNPDTNKKNALPNTGEAKDNNLMAILGMLMVALAGIFGVADLKKAKHSAK